jgi:hypothetical protein
MTEAGGGATGSVEYTYFDMSENGQPSEPPTPIDRKPFKGVAATIPGTVEAENFDEGNYGDSYSGTQGASGEDGDHDYRGEDYPTVDIVNGGTGKAIGYTAKDLWLEYTVNVTEDGEYDIEANVSNGSGSGKLELSLDGKSLASLSFTGVEGDWDTYEKSTGKASLTKGEHVLRITVANDNTNIDYVKFSKEGTTAIAQQVRMNGVAGTVQVFDISGKLLGKVEMVPGVSLSEAIATKFQKSGVYMVKTAAGIQKVRVTSR